MPALSTNMMTRRKGERGTALDSPSVSELLAPNQLAARASNVSTLHGRRDNFVLASLHRSPHGVTCCTSLAYSRPGIAKTAEDQPAQKHRHQHFQIRFKHPISARGESGYWVNNAL